MLPPVLSPLAGDERPGGPRVRRARGPSGMPPTRGLPTRHHRRLTRATRCSGVRRYSTDTTSTLAREAREVA
ncbi:hypothetical protein GUJ93_ZPchr0007g6354 [Zizania palustris]|uniref:Uncharacterized protein n=1 Tax=Zizania palustris TaxID=103762 RepID=A0A8J5TD44_ZIZPA|nr:hypothetical protein GUJ93_ZPchr0007g6354 [Zizania palustris]